MRLAIPTEQGRLCEHFGHCQQFALVDVDQSNKTVAAPTFHTPPPHTPGSLPQWIAQQSVNVVIAGGMGARAVQLLQEAGIQVILGAPCEDPTTLATAWLAGKLVDGGSICDQHASACDGHDHDHGHAHGTDATGKGGC